MSTLYIDRRGATIDLEGDTVVVRVDGTREGTAPLRLLDRVVVHGASMIGSRLVAKLAERGIGLTLLPGQAKQPASVLCPAQGDAALRLAQASLALDGARRDALAADLVRGKLAGQAQLLRRAEMDGAARDGVALNRAIRQVDAATQRLDSATPGPSRNTLRGIEGAAASAYFTGLQQLFSDGLGFTGRNRRPPRDPVNVCLSLGYTILHHRAVHAIVGQGIDPAIGLYHEPARNRESLACDLAEPLRPLVDHAVVAMFREGELASEDFTTRGIACRMGKEGRRRFYQGFEERMQGAAPRLAASVQAFVRELQGAAVAARALRFE